MWSVGSTMFHSDVTVQAVKVKESPLHSVVTVLLHFPQISVLFLGFYDVPSSCLGVHSPGFSVSVLVDFRRGSCLSAILRQSRDPEVKECEPGAVTIKTFPWG